MGGFDVPLWNSIEEKLVESTRLENVIRWQKYVKKGEAMEENSLQHSYTASLLAIVILENEIRHSGMCFDPYFVLKAVMVHDIGEIETGDTVYIDKNEEGENKEYGFFMDFISRFPEKARKPLRDAYDLQYVNKKGLKTSIEADLFEAIERFGYVVFSYREYRRGNDKIFVQTLRNQNPHLIRLANRLPGFGNEFYNQEIQSLVGQFLIEQDGKFIEQKGE